VRRTITLPSPVTGFIVEKGVLDGQRVMAGDPLYKVADLSTVWVEGEIFERDLAAVRIGQPVTATLESFPGRSWSGRITYIYPTVNAETRTGRVRIEIRNSGELKQGMYATLELRGAGRSNVLTVPRGAVLVTGTRSLVFVRGGDGRLGPREVTVGAATSDRIEVLSGLTAGETVVASATFLVDAESNLGSLLGGMGNMPGMDMAPPASPPAAKAPAAKTPPPADHSTHR
jgi:membrane fusion protein, copper/silver efflux system